MTNFKVGQKVVCIKKDRWISANGKGNPKRAILPVYNEICLIVGLDDGDLILDGYEFDTDGIMLAMNPKNFRPIYETDATQEILTNFQPSEDRVDLPVKEKVYT